MSFVHESRLSDSPFLETVTRGYTVGSGSVIRPAETNWHMVFVKYQGISQAIVTGPLTTSGVVSFTEGAEILWVKFKLGTFIPLLPSRTRLNGEMLLPDASSKSFWLNGSAWQYPDAEDIETFVARLVRDQLLVQDPLVDAALQGETQELSARTLRHRFLQATGMSHNHIRQIRRAQQAAALLAQGNSILDTMDVLGYYDQPHLTRALKQWIGHTPAELWQRNPIAHAVSTVEK